ncbi:hypothetical protein WJX73_006892 [Symbiochloris irregularis]|uniref:Uncharacterized protein n=1 Tax=Symbiochloris irregularis TaxID=706552 RepID=A0AAW1PYP4_9CHLO
MRQPTSAAFRSVCSFVTSLLDQFTVRDLGSRLQPAFTAVARHCKCTQSSKMAARDTWPGSVEQVQAPGKAARPGSTVPHPFRSPPQLVTCASTG